MNKKEVTVIGANTYIDIVGVVKDVPAKVDTGADSSSIWASGVSIDSTGKLHYVLFDKKSPFYNGEEFVTASYSVAGVVSSSGHRQIRYRTKLPVIIKGRRIMVEFNLSNRSKHQFPILIGKRTLRRKFIVDVADAPIKPAPSNTERLKQELQENPYEFYRKYHEKKLQKAKE